MRSRCPLGERPDSRNGAFYCDRFRSAVSGAAGEAAAQVVSPAAPVSPIETAVAAIRVDKASPRTVISWTGASGRSAFRGRGSGIPAGDLDIVDLPRINTDFCRIKLPRMPARVGLDCGEAVDE